MEKSWDVHALGITSNYILISYDAYFKNPVPAQVYNEKFDFHVKLL